MSRTFVYVVETNIYASLLLVSRRMEVPSGVEYPCFVCLKKKMETGSMAPKSLSISIVSFI